MAIYSSTLAWKISWMEEPDRADTVHGVTESDMTKRLHFHFYVNYFCHAYGSFYILFLIS